MSHKLLDLYPKILSQSEKNLDLSKFTALALPVIPGDKVELVKSRFLKEITEFTKLNLNIELANWPDFTAKPGEIIEVPISAGSLTRIYLVGVGDEGFDDLRKASSALGRKFKSTNSKVLVNLTSKKELITSSAVSLILSNYLYSLKSEQKSDKPSFAIYGNFEQEVERADVLASAVWKARDLVHTPSNIKNPDWLAKQAASMVSNAKNSDLSISVKSGRAIKDFGGLLAVGNSSPTPGPRLIQVSYAPKGSSNWPHVVLIGKGITFDTGGLATLTGAATLGLGRQYAAMYTRNTTVAKKLAEAGNRVGDRVWQMPLVDDYSVALASDVADFNHTADKFDFSAGSVTAALFLEKFVGDRTWVHLDIAGTGRSEVDAGENIKGGTGYGVRLLIEWLDSF